MLQVMPRFHPVMEQNIVIVHLRQLLATFPTTKFSILDLESIGGTCRTYVNEVIFWRNKQAVLEVMGTLLVKGIVKYSKLDWNMYKEFEVVPENISGVELYKTPNDIISNMYESLKTKLPDTYGAVIKHLRDVEKVLSIENAHDYSDVAHKCQAAYEDFIDILMVELKVTTRLSKERTKSRLSEIFSTISNPDGKLENLIESLDKFHEASSEYNEKLEHRNMGEKNVSHQQAERAFIYTFMLINEVYNFVRMKLS